jgi:hypothetical protein
MKCRFVLPALLVAGLCMAGTEVRAFTLLGSLRGGDDWVQKDATQKGHVQKGHVQKGCEQKGQVQKGCEQKAFATRVRVQRAGLMSGLHVQKGAVQKGCEQKAAPCVQKGAVQKGCEQKAAPCVQKGAVQKGCEQKAAPCVQKGAVQKAPHIHRGWMPRWNVQGLFACAISGNDQPQRERLARKRLPIPLTSWKTAWRLRTICRAEDAIIPRLQRQDKFD